MSYSQKYIQKQFIGRGQFGKVYLVISRQHLFNVAKKIQLRGLTKQQKEATLKEVSIHKNLHHSHIIEFKQFFMEAQTLIVIMELCEFGDLSFYIKKMKQSGKLFQQKVIMNFFMQLLFGLNYLHENKVLHRDLKTSNIFINSEGKLKLGDFGISKVMEHTQQVAMTLVGTPFYLSPQICRNQGYTFKSDVWALGCILYQLCTLKRAFDGSNVLSLANKIVNQEVQDISPNYSEQLNHLIKWLLMKDPQKRPFIKDIFQHKLVRKYTDKFTNTKQKFGSFNNKQVEQQVAIKSAGKFSIKQTYGQLQQSVETLHSNRSKNSVDDLIQISPVKQRNKVKILRQKCEMKMGKDLFKQIYSFWRTLKNNGAQDFDIEQEIRSLYSKQVFGLAMDIAQLIYTQDTQ